MPGLSNFPAHCGTQIYYTFDAGTPLSAHINAAPLYAIPGAIASPVPALPSEDPAGTSTPRTYVGAFVDTHACKNAYEELTKAYGPPVSQTPVLSRKGFGRNYFIAVWYKD